MTIEERKSYRNVIVVNIHLKLYFILQRTFGEYGNNL